MVQVRDNRKVCRLAVSLGVFALPNRGVGRSKHFSNRLQAPGCTARGAGTIRAITASIRRKLPFGLTPNNTKSRQITVNCASFS